MSFTQALLSISPMGMTMPTRINPAVPPPRGVMGVGVGYMYMNMDALMAPKAFTKSSCTNLMDLPSSLSAEGMNSTASAILA